MAPPMYNYFEMLEQGRDARLEHDYESEGMDSTNSSTDPLVPELPETDEYPAIEPIGVPEDFPSIGDSEPATSTTTGSDASSLPSEHTATLDVNCLHRENDHLVTCAACRYWNNRLYYPASMGEDKDDSSIDLERYPGGREDSLLLVKGVRRLSEKERKRFLEMGEGKKGWLKRAWKGVKKFAKKHA